MGAPWEEQEPASGPKAPWEESDSSSAPSAVQQAHPDFTLADRLKIKWTSSEDDPQAIQYLKGQHPNMDIKLQDGQIVGKNPGESEYGYLDPSSGFGPKAGLKEGFKDALDLGYDAATGLVATGSGAGAGLLSFGNPAAVAAGGGAGAYVMKDAQQKLGKWFGVRSDNPGADKTEKIVAGVTGGLPLGQLAKIPTKALTTIIKSPSLLAGALGTAGAWLGNTLGGSNLATGGAFLGGMVGKGLQPLVKGAAPYIEQIPGYLDLPGKLAPVAASAYHRIGDKNGS